MSFEPILAQDSESELRIRIAAILRELLSNLCMFFAFFHVLKY